MVSRTLKNFEDTLKHNADFVRCHKSYMVNKNYIENYVKSDGGYLQLTTKTEIPINTESIDEIMRTFKIVRRN